MPWMPDYVPCFGDLDLPRAATTPTDRMRRTRSRAYQLCAWEGYTGIHDIFLGRWLRAAGHLVLVGTLVWLGLLLPWQHDPWRVVACLVLLATSVGWWRFDLHQLAGMPDAAAIFQGVTPTWWIWFMHSSAHSFSWMTNRWGDEALARYEKAYPDLPSDIVRWELAKRGRLLDERPVELPVDGRVWE